ncbi:hypothetical protein [Streptomyces sp. MBT62]|uniref:hypothetical protein n=1 Tax=Streptomyces sp. MBT62 TaxID=2800410 RepID=UPI00190C5826|nr:hypothetical protein [Streptomyces sp. MBT62]MBK3569754.1 hypothetical protein [Streptomyces sp. MBT62]
MSADRETNHTMTDRDIAFLLADAADEVEIGIAPYQAVIRGGRRRRARRWALATAAALVITGASGTLALASLRDTGGSEVTPAVSQKPTRPSTPEERHVYVPQETMLGTGTDKGKDWYVTVDVWGAPRTKAEAQAQLTAMSIRGDEPWDKDNASALIGKVTYFVQQSYGSGDPTFLMGDSASPQDTMAGTDLKSGASTLDPKKTGGPQRLVVGQVAKTARTVQCTWKDGTSTEAHRVASGADVNSDEATIRPAAGSPDNWFVCVAPEGTSFDSVKVTK